MRYQSRQGHRPTPDAKLVAKHNVRAPKRTVVETGVGQFGASSLLSCGHTFCGRGGSVVGNKVTCYTCQVETANRKERESNG